LTLSGRLAANQKLDEACFQKLSLIHPNLGAGGGLSEAGALIQV